MFAAATPSKDRFPPPGYDPTDTRRRLAVLVDAGKIGPGVFKGTLLPAIEKHGRPILTRLFAHTLTPEWETEQAGGAQQAELFQVEKFIPVPMQMAADAEHIVRLSSKNKVQGVVFVCHEVEREWFEANAGGKLKGKGFNQYYFDELGFGSKVVEDGRSENGQ